MRSTTRRRPAGGFTLVELIVVMVIIAILVSLTLSAVSKARDAAKRAVVKADIGELGLAIESYKSTYDVKYLPGAIILANDYAATATANPTWAVALNDSRQYLTKVWPKAGPGTAFPDNISALGDGTVKLDGNQAMVFFLGGIPTANSLYGSGWAGSQHGFLNSPTNPFNISPFPAAKGSTAMPTNSAQVKGPFFTFKADRLDANGHYLDPYGWPYYYFSAKNGNDYNFYGNYKPAFNPSNDKYGFTDQGGYGGLAPGTTLPNGFVVPKASAGVDPMNPFVLAGKFVRPDSFQIVSAGKDNMPGPGGTSFTPGSGAYSPAAPGGDDLANFHDGMLASD